VSAGNGAARHEGPASTRLFLAVEYVKDLIDRRVAEGRGADGFSSLIETINNQRKDRK
jgi:hypothetical protein